MKDKVEDKDEELIRKIQRAISLYLIVWENLFLRMRAGDEDARKVVRQLAKEYFGIESPSE